jgi:hypothetical protein
MPRSPRTQEPKNPGAQVPRCPIAQEPRCTGAQIPLCPRAQVPRSQEPRCAGAQMPRIGAQMPRSPSAQEPSETFCCYAFTVQLELNQQRHHLIFYLTRLKITSVITRVHKSISVRTQGSTSQHLLIAKKSINCW